MVVDSQTTALGLLFTVRVMAEISVGCQLGYCLEMSAANGTVYCCVFLSITIVAVGCSQGFG